MKRVRFDRLRAGEAIYLVAAILLFVLMFLDWYGVSVANTGNTLQLVNVFPQNRDAWSTLGVIPLFLMLAIAVAVGAALLRIGGSDWKPAVPPAAAVCVLGLLASLLILIRIVSPPELISEVEGSVWGTTLKLPIFLALAAALGIAYGGWRAMGEEGTSFGAIAKRLEAPKRPTKPRPAPQSKSSGRPKS